jgi:predicted transcriptional regulator
MATKAAAYPLTCIYRLRYIAGMTNPTPHETLPSSEDVRARLSPLTRPQLLKLALLSDVSFYTLQKIASGETADPRLDTVRLILPHVEAAKAA